MDLHSLRLSRLALLHSFLNSESQIAEQLLGVREREAINRIIKAEPLHLSFRFSFTLFRNKLNQVIINNLAFICTEGELSEGPQAIPGDSCLFA